MFENYFFHNNLEKRGQFFIKKSKKSGFFHNNLEEGGQFLQFSPQLFFAGKSGKISHALQILFVEKSGKVLHALDFFFLEKSVNIPPFSKKISGKNMKIHHLMYKFTG